MPAYKDPHHFLLAKQCFLSVKNLFDWNVILNQFCIYIGISEESCITGEEDEKTKSFLLGCGCYTPNQTETLALYLHSSHSFTTFFHSHLSLAVCLNNPNMISDTYQIAEIDVVSHALWRSGLSLLHHFCQVYSVVSAYFERILELKHIALINFVMLLS